MQSFYKISRSFFLILVGLFLASMGLAGQVAVAAPEPIQKIDTISQWCNSLGQELRSVHQGRCEKRAWQIEARSAHGQVIPSIFWGALETDKDDTKSPRKILILGAIHGDEIAAVSVVFRWLDFLDRTKTDSFVRKNRYLFVPLVNPDGFYSKPRSRTNVNGVDLNRNFSTASWEQKALRYWKDKARSDPRRYPGIKPAGEVETQVIQKWIDTFQPDLIISIHAPLRLIDHDGSIVFPAMRSPLPVKTLGAFPGSLGTYAGLERKIPVVTPELPAATTLPSVKALEELFLFILKAKY